MLPRMNANSTRRSKFTDPTPAQRAREEAQRRNAEKARLAAESQRALFSVFGMWTICPVRLCRRQHACRGDVRRCANERWHPVAPPELKAFLQKFHDYHRDGMSFDEAIAAADADMERHARRTAEIAAEAAAMPAVPEPPPAPPRVRRTAPLRRGPRVRSL